MTKVIPSLSEIGWITESKKILNNLVSYYILTDAAQSLAYQGNLINLPETYYKYINDPDGMANAVSRDLESLLSRYFQMVDVETEAKDLGDSRYAVLIYASVVDDAGVRVELSRVTQIDSTGLRRIVEINNRGDARNLMTNLG